MRFIRQEDVQVRLPSDWESEVARVKRLILNRVREVARQARNEGKTREEVKKLVCKVAHEAIDDNPVWTKTKNALAFVSFDKCWYCECKQARSDLHIDHFRPKGRALKAKGHYGYWWLAFEWKNLRLACTFCNCIRNDIESEEKGGKGNWFPIFDSPARMYRPHDPLYRTKLLDPVIRNDVEKITFTSNGLAIPVAKDESCEDWVRADETIRIFHLKETRLKRVREQLAIDIEIDFDLANSCYKTGDMDSFNKTADRLLSRVRPDAEYATFARLILGRHRDTEWFEKLWSHL